MANTTVTVDIGRKGYLWVPHKAIGVTGLRQTFGKCWKSPNMFCDYG